MAINRNDNIQALNFDFTETPLQPLIGALQSRQRRYDQNFALADDLSNKYINSLEVDRPRANKITSDIQTKIDGLVKNSSGDFSSLTKDLYAIKRDVNKQFSAQGEAGAIMANKAIFDKRSQEERDRLKKGEITQEQFSLWYNSTNANYKGIGDFDPVAGGYNVLNTGDIAKYVDAYDLGIDIAKELEPIVGEVEYDSLTGNWITTKGSKKEILDPNFINQVVANRLAANDQYMNYLTQTMTAKGMGSQPQIENAILSVSSNIANAFAKNNQSSKFKLKANPFVLKQMDQDLMKELYRPDIAYDAVSSTAGELPEMSVDKLTRKTLDPYYTSYVTSETGILATEGGMEGYKDSKAAQALKESERVKESDAFSVTDFVYSGKAKKDPNINEHLLRESIKQVPRSSGETEGEYSSKVFDFYNKSRNNSINTQFHAVRLSDPKQQKDLATSVLNQASVGNASVVVFQNGKYSEPMTLPEALDAVGGKMKDMYNEDTGAWKVGAAAIEHATNTKAPNGIKIGVPGTKASIAVINWSEGLNRDMAPITDLASVPVGGVSEPTFLEMVHDKPIVSKKEYETIKSGPKKGQLQEVINIYEAKADGSAGEKLDADLSTISRNFFDPVYKDYMIRSRSSEQYNYFPN